MYVAIVDIKLKEGKEDEFKKWFSESNKTLVDVDGFISRKLIKSETGHLRIVVEHQSKETFIKMHQSPEHAKLHEIANTYFAAAPLRQTYDVIAS